jgi:aspartate carbamoyltransferase catalytic subunit
MPLQIKHLLGLEGVVAKDINLILDTAHKFYQAADAPLKKFDYLKNKTVLNLFIEPSTRTRTSFELAARRLGADKKARP